MGGAALLWVGGDKGGFKGMRDVGSPRDVLEGGKGGDLKGRGVWLGPPSPQGPPMVPAKGGP